MIAARMVIPDNGDFTCAFNNQIFKKIIGVLTAKARKIPINKNFLKLKSIIVLNKLSKSHDPIKEDIDNIANNKNSEEIITLIIDVVKAINLISDIGRTISCKIPVEIKYNPNSGVNNKIEINMI